MSKPRTQFWSATVEVVAYRRDVKQLPLSVHEFDILTEAPLYSTADATSACESVFHGMATEAFAVLMLDSSNRVMGIARIATGTPDQCAVYPQKVFQAALLSCASGIIVAHNHPGGSATPSEADWALIRQLRTAGKILQIQVHDSVIYAGQARIFSMRQSARWSANPN